MIPKDKSTLCSFCHFHFCFGGGDLATISIGELWILCSKDAVQKMHQISNFAVTYIKTILPGVTYNHLSFDIIQLFRDICISIYPRLLKHSSVSVLIQV